MYCKKLPTYCILSLLLITLSCSEDSPPLPDNSVGFDTTVYRIPQNEVETVIKLILARETESENELIIDYSATGMEYGKTFITEPEAIRNRITLPLTLGASETSFKLIKVTDFGDTENPTLTLTIKAGKPPVVPGKNAVLQIKFDLPETDTDK